MQTTHPASRVRSSLAVLIALLFSLALPGVARGQGTEGIVPDPISSKDLRTYADRLDLSREQLLALSELHVGYRENYRELRYGDIQDLFTRLEGFEPMQMPSTKKVKEVIDMRRRIMSMIEELDRSFFEETRALLSEAQRQKMPRILRAREKQRYTLPFYGELGKIDLVELLDEMELTDAERQALGSSLEQYEIASTAGARKLHDEIINTALSVLRKLEELGINEDSFSNPMGMMAALTAVDQALQEAGKDLQAAIVDERQETQRYMRQLAQALPAGRGAALEQAYLEEAYSDVYPDRMTAEPMLRAALTLEDLTEAQRTTLSELHQRYREQHERASQEMRQAIDDRFKTIVSVNPSSWEEHWRRTNELEEKRDDLSEKARDSIQQTLTEDQHARAERQATRLASPGHAIYNERRREREELAAAAAREEAAGAVAQATAENAEAQREETERQRQQPIPNAHIAPLTSSDVNDLAHLLRLDRTQREAAHALLEDYLDRFQTLREERVETLLREPQQRLYNDERQMDVAAANDLQRGRTEIRQAVADLDSDYFDEVEMLLMPAQSQRLEVARLARWLTVFGERGQRFYSPFRVSGTVNLIKLVGDLPLSDEEFDKTLPALRNYAEESIPRKQTAYELTQEQEQLVQRLVSQARANTPGEWMSLSERIREEGASLREKTEQASRELLEIQEQTLNKLRDSLPAAQVSTLLRSFYETAYPNVYPDPTLADPVFDEAMGLRDLTTPQYEALQAAFDKYGQEHARICGRMIEAARNVQMAGENWFDPETQRERARHERMLDTLRFDRDELNALYRMRIGAILTTAQAEKMRTLRREEE